MVKKLFPYLWIVGIYFCFWFLGWMFINLNFENNITSLLNNHLREKEKIYNSLLTSVKTLTSFYFESVLSTEHLIKTLDLSDENLKRRRIYLTLFPLNKKLHEKLQKIEIHIHTKDGKSLLRMYEPYKFGDDLTQVREDVRHVLHFKEPVFGFATGRVLSGLRYTFPIFSSDKRYLGSADVSIPLEYFESLLNAADKETKYRFILKKEKILSKLDPKYHRSYRSIDENWIELNTPFKDEIVRYEFIEFLYKDPLFLKLLKNDFSQIVKYKFDSYYYIVVLIPVKNFKNEVEGYAIGITPSVQIALLFSTFNFYKLSFSFFVAILCVFSFSLYYFFKKTGLEKDRLITIINSMGHGLYVIKDFKIALTNQKMLEMLKFTSKELIGKIDHELFVEPKDKCPICESIIKQTEFEGDLIFKRKDGSFLFVNVKVSHLKGEGRIIETIVIFSDITLRKKIEEKLHIEATTDPLTQLFNRRFLLSILESLTETVKEERKPFSIIMADIDNFKHINDTYGHEVGDEVLKELAKILKENLRERDIIGRWGGEEFLIILFDTTLEDAYHVAEKLRKKVEESLMPKKIKITISLGVSEHSFNENIKDTIKRADEALYEAKHAGKNCVKYKK